jgi:hypothetical protein
VREILAPSRPASTTTGRTHPHRTHGASGRTRPRYLPLEPPTHPHTNRRKRGGILRMNPTRVKSLR